MVTFSSLLLPAFLGGVAVFFMSFFLRMVLKYHWSDFSRLPDEDGVMSALSEQGAGSGQYSFPFCDGSQQMKDPDWQEKSNKGPKGFLTLLPEGPLAMGKALGQSFLFNFGVALFAAWAVTHFLAAEPEASLVWCFVATIGFLAFGASSIWDPIWMGSNWRVCLLKLMDGALYGVAMGLPFYLLF